MGTILEQYRQSGLTQRVFAQRTGMSVSTLQYWLRRAQPRIEETPCKSRRPVAVPAISLLEVELAGSAPPGDRGRSPGGYEIEWRSGACLRLPDGFTDEEVRRLLTLLKEVN